MKQQAFLVAIALGLLSAASTQAQSNILRGKVRSTDRTTVNNAIVELRSPSGGVVSETVTGNDGDFTFGNLSSGEYEVTVSMAGYERAVQSAVFHHPDQMKIQEILSIEVMIRPKREPVLPAPGTSFAQDVPRPARAAYDRGMSRLREGKAEEGVAALREAIAQFNDYFDAHFALAKQMFRTGKDDEAIAALERARQINDRQDAVYYMFGLVMMKQGKYTVAEYVFGEAARLNPNVAASRFYHAQTLIELGVRESDEQRRATGLSAAEQDLDRAWELSNKRLNAVYLQRARIHERRGEKESAARDLESYLKAEPEAQNAAALRAAIAKLRGENK